MVKKINTAFCNKLGTEMSVNEVSEYGNYPEIQNHLFCTTTDCPAKLTFVFSTTGNHFRTHRLDDHLPTCIYAFDRENSGSTIIYSAIIQGRMSEKDKDNKLKYAFSKFFKNTDDDETPTTNDNKGKNVVKIVNPNKRKTTTVTKVILEENTNATDIPDTETLRNTYGNISIEKHSTKELNQIISSDMHKKINLTTYATGMKRLKNSYEITLEHNDRKGILVLTESFLKSTTDIQSEEYLTNLMSYLNTASDERFQVLLFSLCELRSYNENEDLIFYMHDFNSLKLTILNNKPQLLSLPIFNLLYTKGNFTI